MLARMLAGIGAAAIALSASVALACSCADFPSAAAHAASADAIFVGRVVDTRHFGEFQQRTTFEVTESIKGNLGARVTIQHGGANMVGSACGMVFRVGREELVIAHENDDVLYTSSCAAPRWEAAEYRAAMAQAARD